MYQHFKGEEVFVNKVLEYKDHALNKQKLILTKFLNPYHQSIVKSIVSQSSDLIVLENGGYLDSENKRMIIAPSFYQIEEEDFKLVVVHIKYAKHFDELKHKDVLGALMSLGIKRELFGDIVESDNELYLILDETIYDYIKQNLTKIKRSKINLNISTKIISNSIEYSSKTFILSSFRLDKVIASFYKMSRAKAAQYIQAGFVKVNHKDVVEINYLCNNSDIISFKKHGRVKFVDLNRKTKQGNYVAEGYFYK